MILLSLFYMGVFLYLLLGWNRLNVFSGSNKKVNTRVSIIIAARNEEDKLEKTIQDILAQDYPKHLMEVIIVDDHSTDRTPDIIRKYAAEGVRLIQLYEEKPFNSYKKKAISEAIGTSESELIVTTDADCRMNPGWLKTIVALYEEKGFQIISAPVAYFEEKSAFEEMQTLEFLFLIGLGASAMGNKVAATCNGANLAYTRKVFIELKGFQGIDQLASGDDELFLHKVAAAYPKEFGFCLSREAVVYTHAKPDLKSLIQQRKRWASKSTKYKNKSLVGLGIAVWLFNLLIVFSAAAAFFNPVYIPVLLIGLVPKVLSEFLFLWFVCGFVRRRRLLAYLPLLTIIHGIYLIYIGIAGNSGKYEWKGRSVN